MVCGAVTQGGITCHHTAQKLRRTWGQWMDLPKARWQRSGDGAAASPVPWREQALPPVPGAASTGTVLVWAACMPRAAGTLVLEPFSTSCRARCLLAHNRVLFLLLLWCLLYIDAAPQRLLWPAGFLATLPATECCVQAEQGCLPCPPHSADIFQQQPGSRPQEVLAIMWKKVWPWEKHIYKETKACYDLISWSTYSVNRQEIRFSYPKRQYSSLKPLHPLIKAFIPLWNK